MLNPPGPNRDDTSKAGGFDSDGFSEEGRTEPAESAADPVEEHTSDRDDEVTEHYPIADAEAEPATQAIAKADRTDEREHAPHRSLRGERRFTAPGFDAKETAVIQTARDPATEAFRTHQGRPRPTESTGRQTRTAMPQLIPPRIGAKLRPSNQRSWGWVLALILIILALTAIAVLGTVLLTRGSRMKAAQEAQVRRTIQNFDTAVQNGDLAALRSLTCGTSRDEYVGYDEQDWNDTYHQVAAAKQYPVVASIDQIVVNGEHAEANVTAFMAYAPQVRSTRSFDLQFRDDQWKICQTSNS
ncbi:MAG: hypothetical protein JO106_03010 [Mycobacterium sp.]|nr:hypothetical protein [Mycobacterium sp.]